MKKVFLISIFSFISFFIFALNAKADCENFWQSFPGQEKAYYWQGYNGTLGYYYDFDISVDSNGYNYFTSSTTINNLRLYPIDRQFNLSSTTKTQQNGYDLWIFGTWNEIADNYFRYKDNEGVNHFTTTGTAGSSSYGVAGATIYTRNWQGFDGTNSSPYYEINVDEPKINSISGAKIYAIFYSNDDFSYIDTESELYAFLNSLNGITCSTETPPTGEEYNFTNKDFGLLGNMFRDVIVWGFIPKEATLQNFSNLKNILETKAPFSYFYSVKNALLGLTSTTTPAFVLADMGSINTDIFQPLKTGLAWVMWIFFAFWAIRRIGVFVP